MHLKEDDEIGINKLVIEAIKVVDTIKAIRNKSLNLKEDFMIFFFPATYEDEILYSILARYNLRSGSTSYFTTNEDLYNEGIITSSIDLQSNNDRLVENMPKLFKYTSYEIIKNYTLFNYYISFVNAHEKELVLEILKGNDGRGVHSIL